MRISEVIGSIKNIYSVNHKASGMAIPSTYYAGGLKSAKGLINDVLETLDLPDLGAPTLSSESIKAIHNAGSTQTTQILRFHMKE